MLIFPNLLWERIEKRLSYRIKVEEKGTSLVIQWLRLCAPRAGGLGLIPWPGNRSHMLQLRDPVCCSEDQGAHAPQLRPAADK